MNPALKVKSWSVKGQCCVMWLAGRYFTLGQCMYIMTSPPPSKNRIILQQHDQIYKACKATRRNNYIVIMNESHLLQGLLSWPAHTHCCGIWIIIIIGHVFLAKIYIIDCYFHFITIHFLFTETCTYIPFLPLQCVVIWVFKVECMNFKTLH